MLAEFKPTSLKHKPSQRHKLRSGATTKTPGDQGQLNPSLSLPALNLSGSGSLFHLSARSTLAVLPGALAAYRQSRLLPTHIPRALNP